MTEPSTWGGDVFEIPAGAVRLGAGVDAAALIQGRRSIRAVTWRWTVKRDGGARLEFVGAECICMAALIREMEKQPEQYPDAYLSRLVTIYDLTNAGGRAEFFKAAAEAGRQEREALQ